MKEKSVYEMTHEELMARSKKRMDDPKERARYERWLRDVRRQAGEPDE